METRNNNTNDYSNYSRYEYQVDDSSNKRPEPSIYYDELSSYYGQNNKKEEPSVNMKNENCMESTDSDSDCCNTVGNTDKMGVNSDSNTEPDKNECENRPQQIYEDETPWTNPNPSGKSVDDQDYKNMEIEEIKTKKDIEPTDANPNSEYFEELNDVISNNLSNRENFGKEFVITIMQQDMNCDTVKDKFSKLMFNMFIPPFSQLGNTAVSPIERYSFKYNSYLDLTENRINVDSSYSGCYSSSKSGSGCCSDNTEDSCQKQTSCCSSNGLQSHIDLRKKCYQKSYLFQNFDIFIDRHLNEPLKPKHVHIHIKFLNKVYLNKEAFKYITSNMNSIRIECIDDRTFLDYIDEMDEKSGPVHFFDKWKWLLFSKSKTNKERRLILRLMINVFQFSPIELINKYSDKLRLKGINIEDKMTL